MFALWMPLVSEFIDYSIRACQPLLYLKIDEPVPAPQHQLYVRYEHRTYERKYDVVWNKIAKLDFLLIYGVFFFLHLVSNFLNWFLAWKWRYIWQKWGWNVFKSEHQKGEHQPIIICFIRYQTHSRRGTGSGSGRQSTHPDSRLRNNIFGRKLQCSDFERLFG